jgi:hypothetical protein
MQWLETIQVQTNIKQCMLVSNQLQMLIRELLNLKQEPGLLSVEAFCHSTVTGEHLLLMRWDSEDMPKEGSGLGLHIKEIMNHYGLVEHTFWLSLKGEDHE